MAKNFRVAAVDINMRRLESAKDLGVDAIFNTAQPNALDELRKVTGGGVLSAIGVLMQLMKLQSGLCGQEVP